jgi:hypothetical protein
MMCYHFYMRVIIGWCCRGIMAMSASRVIWPGSTLKHLEIPFEKALSDSFHHVSSLALLLED